MTYLMAIEKRGRGWKPGGKADRPEESFAGPVYLRRDVACAIGQPGYLELESPTVDAR